MEVEGISNQYVIAGQVSSGLGVKRYSAWDSIRENQVIIHLLAKPNSEEQQAQWFRRARAMLKLKNSYCQTLLNLGMTETSCYFVTEWVHGQPLAATEERIGESMAGRTDFLPESLALKFIHQLAVALEGIHAERIFHGKLAAENIIVSDSGGIRLTNFFDSWSQGVANAIDDVRGFGQVLQHLALPDTKFMEVANRTERGEYSSIQDCFLEVKRLFPDHF